MKLTEFDNKTRTNAKRALKEHYELPFNVERMSLTAAGSMLQKVRGLIKESKQSPDFHNNQTSASYMKLVFMEQALADHYNELRSQPARIVVENEEVEKSQVVLAAQDLVDSVQKMLEDVGQMQVKELPALVSSIESEIGVNESQQYNDQVSQALDQLSSTLKETFGQMKAALGTVTGQGGGEAFGMDAGAGEIEQGLDDMAAGADEMGMDAGADMGADLPPEDDVSVEEPEMPAGGVGRAKR